VITEVVESAEMETAAEVSLDDMATVVMTLAVIIEVVESAEMETVADKKDAARK
jgi:hypothetical protein